MSITTIRTEIAKELAEVTSLKFVPAIYPLAIPNIKLPAATVYFAGSTQLPWATCAVTKNTNRFRVDIYIQATDQSKAIASLEEISQDILDKIRTNTTLNGVVSSSSVIDAGYPEYIPSGDGFSTPVIMKAFVIETETIEQ